jgi:hypothetical protein
VLLALSLPLHRCTKELSEAERHESQIKDEENQYITEGLLIEGEMDRLCRDGFL